MKVDNISLYAGDMVVDQNLGLGEITRIDSTGAFVKFTNGDEVHFLDGGYFGGIKRLGKTRKLYIEITLGKEELVRKLLAVADVKILNGF